MPRGGKAKKPAWPKLLSEQAAVQAALAALARPASVAEVAERFRKSKQRDERVEEFLDTLVLLGKARELVDRRFVAAALGCNAFSVTGIIFWRPRVRSPRRPYPGLKDVTALR